MSRAPLDPSLHDELDVHGLTREEGDRVVSILDRQPSRLELALFGAMWSEHCSYKSSRVHLAYLPTSGPQVALGPGENAGAARLDKGWVVVFKMESHNHPSYIEPFQGAATGIGGILRDVFTMGARPVCNLDSLRFGAPTHPKTPALMRGVVSGIAFYGNCMGVPTVAGETELDAGYDDNILVNAMTVGIAREERLFLGRAEGAGNPVLYVGSSTGRDGIHGATMASAAFEEDAQEKRPAVQVGDPFTEKKLLEACMELFEDDVVVGIQDMGAAGLTSSSVEMADRTGHGIRLHLDRVPMRAEGMTPYELMLSESQERMLIVSRAGTEERVRQVFDKWDLCCVPIGEVTTTGNIELFWHGDRVADLPVSVLAGTAPKYRRPTRRPERPERPPVPDSTPEEPGEMLAELVGSPHGASRRPVYEQYDHMVQVRTAVRPGGGAAVLRVPEAGGYLAVTSDCDHRAGLLDPREGARRTLAEAARNLSITGALPLAVTDCLNFGNPEVPEVMGAFAEAVQGLREACLAMETPVVSGNVSFYNETRGRSIPPTPTVGVVGWMADTVRPVGAWVEREDLLLWLLGEGEPSLDGSLWQHSFCGRVGGHLRPMSLIKEQRLCELTRRLVRAGLVSAAHDVSAGGLALCLAEMVLGPADCPGGRLIGVRAEGFEAGDDPVTALFGEVPGRVLLATTEEAAPDLRDRASAWGVPLELLGRSGGDRFRLGPVDLAMEELVSRYAVGLEEVLSATQARAG